MEEQKIKTKNKKIIAIISIVLFIAILLISFFVNKDTVTDIETNTEMGSLKEYYADTLGSYLHEEDAEFIELNAEEYEYDRGNMGTVRKLWRSSIFLLWK